MKIVSYNVNGIRSALNKGLAGWLKNVNADVVLLQEIKAMKDQVNRDEIEALGYQTHWKSAEKKGYSGVAIFSKLPVNEVVTEIGHDQYDSEGRYIHANIMGNIIASVYFPSGTSGEERQSFKMKFLEDFFNYQRALRAKNQSVLIGGDYNICHQAIDIHDPVRNKNVSGFLPGERLWMGEFLNDGWIDSFRHLNKDPHHYTWWSNRPGVRAANKGWRIDYHCITGALATSLRSCTIMPDAVHSDHCPVMAEFDL